MQESLESLRLGFYDEGEDRLIDLYTTLQSESGVNLRDYFSATSSLYEGLDDITSEESNTLPDRLPVFKYIRQLARIYKKGTGTEPTATDDQNGSASPFVIFVHSLIKEYHPEAFSE